MFIKGYECGPLNTFAYLVSDAPRDADGRMAACIIDPSYGSAPLVLADAEREGFSITHILNTHGHFDHSAQNFEMQQATAAPIYIHADDEWRLTHPTREKFPIPFPVTPTKASHYLEDGDLLTVGSLEFEVIATPGHTKGGVCFYEARQHLLFAGDTLFKGSVGRWDFEDGDFDALVLSIRRLMNLPDGVRVFSGHGGATTIGAERQTNPFMLRTRRR